MGGDLANDIQCDGRKRTQIFAIIGGSTGNLVEWYDFYTYAALTVYFAPSFFPSGDSTTELLSAAAVFAVGFLVRPLGAWMMGVYADRRGRKAGLALSLGLMGAGSLLIAISPTYAQAGLLAPALLICARMIQGLSVGGEYGASATYLSEMSSDRYRGFWTSFQYVTLIGGQLSALCATLALQALFTGQEIERWAWRLPFVLGAVLAIIVYLLRRKLTETASFSEQRADRPISSFKNLWRNHSKQFWLIIVITAGGSLFFYSTTTYMQKFLINTSGFSREVATQIMTVALIVYMIAQPLFGYLSDIAGRKPLLLVFGIGGTCCTIPAFHAIAETRSPILAGAIIIALLLLLSAYTSISGLIKAELFPPHIRSLGVAFPYAIGNSLFGGTAEYAALSFRRSGIESGFYIYVSAIVACALVAFLILPDTRRHGWMSRG